MTESERLAEVAALHAERKHKAEELAAIDRRIELVLFPETATKRKQKTRSGKDWERMMGSGHECVTTNRRALAG